MTDPRQPPTFALSFDAPQHGWIGFRITCGQTSVDDSFSRTPADTITELAEAADAILSYPGQRVVVFHLEPATLELGMSRPEAASEISVSLVEYSDWRRQNEGQTIFRVVMPSLVFGRVIWRALRKLSTELTPADYEREWRHPYPTRIVEQLGQRLR